MLRARPSPCLILGLSLAACSESSRRLVPGSEVEGGGQKTATASAAASAPQPVASASSSAAPLASASQGAPAGQPAAFPPAAIKPPYEASKVAGDGEWKPIAVTGLEPPAIYMTVIHPHKTSALLEVAIAAIDLSRVKLGLVAGVQEPVSTAVPVGKRSGLIPKDEIDRLIASTNGGFKRKHGNHGMKIGDDEYVPPNDADCTLAMTKSGAIRIGTWSKLKPDAGDFAWLRQGGPCLVENGAVGPDTVGTFVGTKWGVSQEGQKNIRRSAYGISKDGSVLYFAIGNAIDPEAFAPALVAAGMEAACQFDINYSFTRFVVYDHDPKGSPVARSPLMKDLRFSPSEGWKVAAERDFFYMVKTR